jgi:hypothetical protein
VLTPSRDLTRCGFISFAEETPKFISAKRIALTIQGTNLPDVDTGMKKHSRSGDCIVLAAARPGREAAHDLIDHVPSHLHHRDLDRR